MPPSPPPLAKKKGLCHNTSPGLNYGILRHLEVPHRIVLCVFLCSVSALCKKYASTVNYENMKKSDINILRGILEL